MKDALFDDLYTQTDKFHSSLVAYMDSMGQLEVRILKENQKSA